MSWHDVPLSRCRPDRRFRLWRTWRRRARDHGEKFLADEVEDRLARAAGGADAIVTLEPLLLVQRGDASLHADLAFMDLPQRNPQPVGLDEALAGPADIVDR